MLKTISKFLFVSVVSALLLMGSFSCSDDNYLSERDVEDMIEQALANQKQTFIFEVKAESWEWNNYLSQWEAFGNLPELRKHIYDRGIITGYVFLGTEGVDEVQKELPYIDTYSEEIDGEYFTFTETISVDYQLGNPSTIGFFIKDSQLAKDMNAPRNLFFRIVLEK